MENIISHYCVVIESSPSRTETAYSQCSLLYRGTPVYMITKINLLLSESRKILSTGLLKNNFCD